jgi:hypothetical protein
LVGGGAFPMGDFCCSLNVSKILDILRAFLVCSRYGEREYPRHPMRVFLPFGKNLVVVLLLLGNERNASGERRFDSLAHDGPDGS